MGAQAAAQKQTASAGTLQQERTWQAQHTGFNNLHVRAIKLSPNQKRESTTERMVKRYGPEHTRQLHNVNILH